MRVLATLILTLIGINNLLAQGSYVPLGSYSMHIIDRFEIKQGRLATPNEFNTNNKAYQRLKIAAYADEYDSLHNDLSKQDKFNLTYLQNDNFEYSKTTSSLSAKKAGKTNLYKYKAGMFSVHIPDFDLIVNPIVYMRGEYDTKRNDRLPYFVNRGFSIRGRIGNNLSFLTETAEEIQSLNGWNLEYFKQYDVLAGQNFIYTNTYKPNDKYLYSYWNTSGYVAYQAGKYIDMQFGQGRNFIGNGYRSLMRSDFSTNSLFLRINTHIWKINYTNIYGSMYNYTPFYTRQSIIKNHFYATTYANVNITSKLNIGLFETNVFQRDSGYEIKGYDPQYLNPVIFYNAIDNTRNSPDKNILGIDFKYNFAKKYSAYGQFVLSEMSIHKRLTQKDWWGNKEAYQLGIKCLDVFRVNNLDVQLEYNQARPYSYTSFDSRNAYVNYNQSMAHPLGANFREALAIVKYQPTEKLFINSTFIFSTFGNDTNGSNWGKNISLSYNSRMRENGNYIGQGVKTNLLILTTSASYMLKHNLFADLQLSYRNQTSALSQFKSEMFNIGIALRWNMNMRECNF